MPTHTVHRPAGADGSDEQWDAADDRAVPFAAAHIDSLARCSGVQFPETVLGAATAALRAGKHLILTGPPGTGKSTLAKLLADAAQEALMCTGHIAATATSEWTVADTIGTSIDTAQGRVFRAGVVTQAIESGRWLVIDEFNRANIDQAFGELFSVLAGQTVVLPHRRSEFAPALSLVPYGCEPPSETEAICIPKPWRIIATMNTADRGLLFTLSRALMRRFAFVNVSSPNEQVYRQLLDGPGRHVTALLPLRELHDIGPAIFLDAADYVAMRNLDSVRPSLALLEAFNAYFLPQLDALDRASSARLLEILDEALDPPEQQAVRTILREFQLLDVA
ncbi:MAG: 5-methylcytosine-specific restriction enzyme [Acidimicrobiaceae bacterium]